VITIHKTKDFIDDFKRLPSEIKRLFQKQEALFKKSWLDPRLHTKRLKELAGVYSFRVTRRYRVLFYFRDNEAIFFSIGHRKDVYQ
jgi:mRNA-degrading endonuclease RelE of RelBE toxin-antitoxin system